MFTFITVVLAFDILLTIILLATCSKIRKLITWKYSTSLTTEELSDVEVEYLYERRYPGLITLRNLNAILFLAILCVTLSIFSWKVCSEMMSKADVDKEMQVRELITNIYCSDPTEFDAKWEEMKKYIDKDIWYKLNMTSIDNLTNRQQKWCSRDTQIEIETFKSEDRIIARYIIVNPAGEKIERLSIVSIDKENIITGFTEYDLTNNNTVNYMVGEP